MYNYSRLSWKNHYSPPYPTETHARNKHILHADEKKKKKKKLAASQNAWGPFHDTNLL